MSLTNSKKEHYEAIKTTTTTQNVYPWGSPEKKEISFRIKKPKIVTNAEKMIFLYFFRLYINMCVFAAVCVPLLFGCSRDLFLFFSFWGPNTRETFLFLPFYHYLHKHREPPPPHFFRCSFSVLNRFSSRMRSNVNHTSLLHDVRALSIFGNTLFRSLSIYWQLIIQRNTVFVCISVRCFSVSFFVWGPVTCTLFHFVVSVCVSVCITIAIFGNVHGLIYGGSARSLSLTSKQKKRTHSSAWHIRIYLSMCFFFRWLTNEKKNKSLDSVIESLHNIFMRMRLFPFLCNIDKWPKEQNKQNKK